MSVKKILIFIDWFLPGYKAGGPISSNANLIDQLSGQFDFSVITRNTDYCDMIPYSNVTSDAWNILPNGACVYYISQEQLSFKSLINITKPLDFDVVFVNGIYSLYFSLFPLVWFKYFRRKKVVVSARGMLSQHTFSSKKSKKKIFYFVARLIGLYRGVTFHATNDHEANQIRKNLGIHRDVRIVPNLSQKMKEQQVPARKKEVGELHLVSVARISQEKNILFAMQILEKLVNQLTSSGINYSKISFDLYGTMYDVPYWKKCQKIISRLPASVKVTFLGPVEKSNLPATLAPYHFLFMPSQGENYGHSIVESFLAACPVIISDQTPWRHLMEEGNMSRSHRDIGSMPPSGNQMNHLTYGVGWDLPLDLPDSFVTILQTCLMMDQDTYLAMSQRAYEYGRLIVNDPDVLEATRRLFD